MSDFTEYAQTQKSGALKSGARKGGGPKGWGPKFRVFVFLLPPPFSLFFLHLRVPKFKNTTNIPRQDPQREREKKSEILGGPAKGVPTEGGGPLLWTCIAPKKWPIATRQCGVGGSGVGNKSEQIGWASFVQTQKILNHCKQSSSGQKNTKSDSKKYQIHSFRL